MPPIERPSEAYSKRSTPFSRCPSSSRDAALSIHNSGQGLPLDVGSNAESTNWILSGWGPNKGVLCDADLEPVKEDPEKEQRGHLELGRCFWRAWLPLSLCGCPETLCLWYSFPFRNLSPCRLSVVQGVPRFCVHSCWWLEPVLQRQGLECIDSGHWMCVCVCVAGFTSMPNMRLEQRPILEMEAGSRCGGGKKGRTLAVFGSHTEKQVDSVCLWWTIERRSRLQTASNIL